MATKATKKETPLETFLKSGETVLKKWSPEMPSIQADPEGWTPSANFSLDQNGIATAQDIRVLFKAALALTTERFGMETNETVGKNMYRYDCGKGKQIFVLALESVENHFSPHYTPDIKERRLEHLLDGCKGRGIHKEVAAVRQFLINMLTPINDAFAQKIDDQEQATLDFDKALRSTNPFKTCAGARASFD